MSKIPDIFVKYLQDTLFSDDNLCHFLEEVIIDDMPVFITLNYFKSTGVVRLILHNENILKKLDEHADDEKDEYLYNLLNNCDIIHHLKTGYTEEQKALQTLTRLNEIIKDIRFCKYTGKFIHKHNMIYAKIHETLPLIFMDNENVRFKPVECNSCVICYEKTKTISACNHSVCIPCASNINHDIDDDILCPICRDVLLFV